MFPSFACWRAALRGSAAVAVLGAAPLLTLAGCAAESGPSNGTGGAGGTTAGVTPTDANLRVAFIGDQGLGPDAVAVLQLIQEEGADFVIHNGDFDYADDPDAWDAQINSVLGDDYPYFATIGNHDVHEWEGYQAKLQERLAKIDGAVCTGDDLGVVSACTYRGLFFILSGVGTYGFIDHRVYLEQTLAADDSIWRVCNWHVTREDFQVGTKGNEAPLEAYSICADGRAIIANAHEHSYSRTLTLTDVDQPERGYGATGTPGAMEVTEGSSFVFVSGIAGQSQREYAADLHDDDTWWANIYAGGHYLRDGQTSTFFDYDFGALFIDFYINQDPRLARGFFKTIAGDVIDEFTIVTARQLSTR